MDTNIFNIRQYVKILLQFIQGVLYLETKEWKDYF